ncbi:MAG: hypothetical protein ABI472_22915 [Ginsengibacter sp.]
MKQVNQISKLSMLLLVAGMVTFSSCKKDNSVAPAADTPAEAATMNAAQSDAVAEALYDDVFNISMGVQASDAGEDVGIGAGVGVIYSNTTNPDGTPANTPDSASSRCFTVTVVPHIAHQFPKTITIDFGTSGCLGKDGKLRKGKMVTIYTGPMSATGSTTSTTFLDYSVDSFKIEGTHTVQNTSLSNKKQWTVKVIEGKITNTSSGHWRMWSSTKIHTQVDGNGTPLYPLDDKFEITGNATGSNSDGNAWTAEIIDPLVKRFTCAWKVKGTVNITRNSNMAVLDYGDGSCDNEATITINGVTRSITLHK